MTLGSLSLKVGEKTDPSPQIRKNSAKNGVKTAKKPILREKCAAEPEKPSPKRSPKSLENLIRYEAGDIAARMNGSKGGKIRALNAAMLKDNALAAAKGNRIPKLIDEALDDAFNAGRIELAAMKMAIAEKAAKLVGATHDQSPEASQNVNLKADVKKAETVKLIIEDFTKPPEGAAGE